MEILLYVGRIIILLYVWRIIILLYVGRIIICGEDYNHINRFNSASFCACPKQGAGFPTSYVGSLFMFSDLRREVIVRCVDSVGIIDNHCSIFRFKMNHHCDM